MEEIEAFIEEQTGICGVAESDRVLMTVAFTDIVGSTEQAARLGDRRWRELLEFMTPWRGERWTLPEDGS